MGDTVFIEASKVHQSPLKLLSQVNGLWIRHFVRTAAWWIVYLMQF